MTKNHTSATPIGASGIAKIAARTPPVAWWILFVLGLVFALFAGDRAILGILKTTLSAAPELGGVGLTNKGYSLLVTMFMVPYTVMYLFVGGWIDRIGVKVTLTICVGLMSLATVIAATSHGVAHFAVARFTLGIAEAGVVPAITVAIFMWFSSERRALAYSLANAVQSTAYILCPPFVAFITLNLSWRWAFLIPGSLGFVIAAMWWHANKIAGKPPAPEAAALIAKSSGPELNMLERFREVLKIPAVRMLILARIISDPFWFFFQYWQTPFLQERIGMSLERVGQITWIPPLVYTVVALCLSMFSDRLVKNGMAAPKARLVLILSATVFAPAAFCLPFVRSEWLAIGIITLTSIMCSTWLNMSSVFMGTLVPRNTLASAIGLMSALGGVTSILFNALVGTIIDLFGYNIPFWFGACLHPIAAGLLAWYFFFGRNNSQSPTTAP